MTLFRRALAAIFMAGAIATPVALAATSDVQLLHSYAGSWNGSGALTGEGAGNVSCRLTMSPRGEQLTFNGRCSIPGTGSQSFQGAIAYNERANRYEAISRGSEAVIGRRSGGGIVFNFEGRNPRGDMQTTMSLRGGNQIVVEFTMVNRRNGEKTAGRIPFAKA